MGSGACPAEFLAKTLIRPVFEFVRFRVFVRRRGSRVRGAARRPRRAKTKTSPVWVVSKAVAFLPNGHFPYGQLVRPPGHERMRTHAGGPGPRRGRFRAFHGEEINGSCLIARARTASCRNRPRGSVHRQVGHLFAAADARYGRGRPCDARGACWGGATDASRLFSRRKTMVG